MRLLIICFGIFAVSCTSTTIEEDMSAYCDCIHENGEAVDNECAKLAEEMAIKYEYDPGALDYIEEELRKCRDY